MLRSRVGRHREGTGKARPLPEKAQQRPSSLVMVLTFQLVGVLKRNHVPQPEATIVSSTKGYIFQS